MNDPTRLEGAIARWRVCSTSCGACGIRQAGCPWDREQDFASIAPYTIEEAYEVADAIARGEPRGHRSRARRSAVPGGVPCADGRRARLVRFRQCRRCDLRQAHRRGIRMCSATRKSARRANRIAPGKNTRRANARRDRSRRRASSPTCRWRCRPWRAPRNSANAPAAWASTGRMRSGVRAEDR